MIEREKLLLLLPEQANAALVEKQKKLSKAEEVVAECRDDTEKTFKNRNLGEWKQEVAELKEMEKILLQREKVRAAFMAVVSQGNFIL
jgi:hypothetical protein